MSDPRRYVLSAGRTGTVFFTELLHQLFPEGTVVHEPSPTRQQMMLANMRNDWGVMGAPLKAWFNRTRVRNEAGATPYVELNPFLCAFTDLLPDESRPLRIVHMVREPQSWAQSMTVFKASTRFRHVIDYIPFAKPFPSPRPEGWSKLDHYERNLHRWVWCNTRILALKDQAQAFATIRYEDVFRAGDDERAEALQRMLDTLGLNPEGPVDWDKFARPSNPAPQSNQSFDPDAANRIAGDLARKMGYDL